MATTPQAWLGCESCYVAGRLTGRWYDITEIGDITQADLHGHPTSHEEAVCMDTVGIPVDGEPSQDEAAQWGDIYQEVGADRWPALCAWVRSGSYIAEGNTNYPVISDFEERFAGEWVDFDEFAWSYIVDTGMQDTWPEEARTYFSFERWARDLAMDYSIERNPSGGVFVFRDF